MVALIIVVAILMAINSYLVVQREVALFRSDMNLHAYLLGSVLASSASDIWRSTGPERVRSIVADANRSENLVRVRWVRFDVPPDNPDAPLATIPDLRPLETGHELLFSEYQVKGKSFHIAYFPVQSSTSYITALELSQPLSLMHNYVRATVLRHVVLFVSFILVGSLLFWWLGIHLVGRPIHTLVRQAHTVGEGDLDVRNNLTEVSDEIGELARGMNDMVERLGEAHRRVEHETARRIEAIEQLNHAERLATVGKLASGLAHELGTPLNVVAGRAKMIADEEMSRDEIVDSASVIRNQAERMTGIIRQLLDFARRKRSEKKLEDIALPVRNVLHVLTPIASQSKVELKTDSDGNTTQVMMDSGQIQQIISNLVVNAIHAMPNGGLITIGYGQRTVCPPADRGDDEGEYGYIEVIDNGVGIPQENLSRIFTPFFSTKQVGEGTGLGLSIAHGIATEHGGWLTVDSTVGVGTKFTLYLPLGKTV